MNIKRINKHFFCGVIVFKVLDNKDNYQIEKFLLPNKIGLSSEELNVMSDNIIRQKDMVRNMSNKKDIYVINTFISEKDFIEIMLERGYSKSFIADKMIRIYKKLSQIKLFGF